MNKIQFLILVLLLSLIASCNYTDKIEYLNSNTPVTLIIENDRFKIVYESINIEKNNGFSVAEVTIFNKGVKPVYINSLSLLELNHNDIIGFNKISNIEIEGVSDSQNPFLPQRSVQINEENESINEVYQKYNRIETIKVVVEAELYVNENTINIHKEIRVRKHNSVRLL